MKILHLSDIHYDINNQAKFNELLNELKKCIQTIDIIFITGDLINRGNAGTISSDYGFEIFDKEFICPLLDHFQINRSAIILSPGNHDIDRTKINKISEFGLQKVLLDEDSVSEIINKGINSNFYEEYDRIKSYKEYVKLFYKDSKNSKITLFHDTHIFNMEDVQVGITSFNTAWRCYSSENDQEKLILGVQQCLLAAEEINKCDIKIGLLHHEPSFLSDYEKIEPRLRKNYDILCSGHIHAGKSFKYYTTNTEVINLTSPGFCTENMFTDNYKYSVGFSIINIEKENGNVDIIYYKWSQSNTEFNVDPEHKIEIPLKIRSLLSKINTHSSDGTIIERNYQSENNIFKNNSVDNNINEFKNYQENLILTKTNGVLYSAKYEIKKILEKVDGYNLFSSELDFILLYGDKVINNNRIIYAEFEDKFINYIIQSNIVINKRLMVSA